MSVEIQFTRIRKDYFVTNIEADALTALLDAHKIGEMGESLSDRLWAANAYSAQTEAFWAELADQGGSEAVDNETDYDLDEENSDEDEDDDDEQDGLDDDNADTLEYVDALTSY